MNRRIPNGTYGGVRSRGLAALSYSIYDYIRSTETPLSRQRVPLLEPVAHCLNEVGLGQVDPLG